MGFVFAETSLVYIMRCVEIGVHINSGLIILPPRKKYACAYSLKAKSK